MHGSSPAVCGRGRVGFTLIELLVVIAIIAILIALILAAAQQARESANKAVCTNNLRQMAIAANSHVMLYGRYPAGGWGWGWCGDPDRGANGMPTGQSSPSQPGGWIYNILPFTEYQNIHDMGKGLPAAAKQQAIAQRVGIAIKMFNCPTRRTGGPYPNAIGSRYGECGGTTPPALARADYAGNIGDNSMDEYWWGPPDEKTGDTSWQWHNTSSLTGVTFERSWIRPQDITKGLSDVYLYGEKYLDPDHYYNGVDGADNENMYCGMDNDICRDTASAPHRDQSGWSDTFAFGSKHLLGFNMAYCDGSVRFVLYNVNPAIHKAAGNRNAN
jgi:prepilin-type N-terminal cleavage/methylation domain-containing protein/prepilin-type processing-associated H-X9-DG protein